MSEHVVRLHSRFTVILFCDFYLDSVTPKLTGGTAQAQFFKGKFDVELVPLEPFHDSDGTVLDLNKIFENGMISY